MLQEGQTISYGGNFWEIFGFETDDKGYLCVILIEPNCEIENTPSPSIIVRDIFRLQQFQAA